MVSEEAVEHRDTRWRDDPGPQRLKVKHEGIENLQESPRVGAGIVVGVMSGCLTLLFTPATLSHMPARSARSFDAVFSCIAII